MGKAFYETRTELFFLGGMTQYPFPLHVHEIVEMAYLYTGECEIEIDGAPRVLHPGDAMIAFPLIPHSFDRISPGTRGLAAFFSADMIPELALTFHTLIPDDSVVLEKNMPADARLAAERLDGLAEDSPSRIAFLHLLLANLLHGLTYHSAADYNERDLGTKVVRYVYGHACEEITLSSVARALGISESHLSHLFSQQFHVNFRRFINAIRIDKAIALMHDPYMTLTQICFQCGYDNARTFRRAFMRETGVLPAQYIRSLRLQEKEAR